MFPLGLVLGTVIVHFPSFLAFMIVKSYADDANESSSSQDLELRLEDINIEFDNTVYSEKLGRQRVIS